MAQQVTERHLGLMENMVESDGLKLTKTEALGLIADLKELRTAQAADVATIALVVRQVAADVLSVDGVITQQMADAVNAIATRAAEQLATGVPNALPDLEQAFKAGFEYARDDSKPCWPEWIEAHGPALDTDIVRANPAADAIVADALTTLGADLQPPAGWEARVMAEVEGVSLNVEEANLADRALDLWSHEHYKAPHGDIGKLRCKLQDFITKVRP